MCVCVCVLVVVIVVIEDKINLSILNINNIYISQRLIIYNVLFYSVAVVK